MLYHEPLRPPSRDYPADEWNVVEKRFNPEFLAQSETMMALATAISACVGARKKVAPTPKTAP